MARFGKILKDDVNPSEIHSRDLTSDCYYVQHRSGQIDIARAGKMVDVFDLYYDLGIVLQRIDHAGGRLNPKFQEPRL
jgi:hypothetical protein